MALNVIVGQGGEYDPLLTGSDSLPMIIVSEDRDWANSAVNENSNANALFDISRYVISE